MLESWQLQNFKAIRGPATLDLRSVTVLSGLNSSGKSSVLQSVLLVSQTLANQLLEKPLVLNGYQVQLGTFDAIKSDFSRSRQLHIGFSAVLMDRRRRPTIAGRSNYVFEQTEIPIHVQVSATFSGAGHGKGQVLDSSQVNLVRCQVNVATTLSDSSRRLRAETSIDDSGAQELAFGVTVNPISEKRKDALTREINVDYQPLVPLQQGQIFEAKFTPGRRHERGGSDVVDPAHFLPRAIWRTYDISHRRREEFEYEAFDIMSNYLRYGDTAIRMSRPRDTALRRRLDNEVASQIEVQEVTRILGIEEYAQQFGGGSIGELLRWAGSVTKQHRNRIFRPEPEMYSQILALLSRKYAPQVGSQEGLGIELARGDVEINTLTQTTQELITFFAANVRYLGPLRAEPGQVQAFALSNQLDDVGPRGEHAAAVFHAFSQRSIRWWNPINNQFVLSTLQEAVDFWLQHLEIAMDASTQDRGQSGVSWLIQPKPSSKSRALSSVGVGVSQVLPILVLGLLVQEGSLLLIEQPELHLHPRAQARLADFFLSLAATKKQLLIETHSDSLINQFRLQMVRGGQSVKEEVKIYFAQADEDGSTIFEEINIDDAGNIENWPEGFFDENLLLEDQIASAVLESKLLQEPHAQIPN